MRIGVIGTGYVGLVSGVCLSDIGNDVICVDCDDAKIDAMQSGFVPIYEPGLPELMARNLEAGRLAFTTDLDEAVARSEVLFITVGTPALPSGEPDLSAVEEVARAIGRSLASRPGSGYKVIVNKSTVPVGSGDLVAMLIREGMVQAAAQVQEAERTRSALTIAGAGVTVGDEQDDEPPQERVTVHWLEEGPAAAFDVVSNPEFLREGSAIQDTFFPDRIVVGSQSRRAVEIMRELYGPIVDRQLPCSPQTASDPVPFIVTDLNSAEMIKYAANAFLATKISFINEIGNICERVGADVTEVARGIGLDARIGRQFLSAGIGWGGSCFPKDVSALYHIAKDYGYVSPLLTAVQEVNQRQKLLLLSKLQQHLKVLKGKVVAVWGLSFKPGTDDLRDAPSLAIIRQLTKLGARVKAYDPVAAQAACQLMPELVCYRNPYTICEGADAVVLVTEWPEFRDLDLKRVRAAMRNPLLLDGRNLFDPQVVTAAGLKYVGIGR